MNTNSPIPPIDPKDPRFRVTFADVAMKIASDGPMYGVILLVGILALRGTTTALETIIGAAVALLARSHPPPPPPSKSAGITVLTASVCLALVGGAALAACMQ